MIRLEHCSFSQAEAISQLGDSLVFSVDPSMITKLVKKECQVGNDWVPQRPFFENFIVGGDWDKDFGAVKLDRNFLEIGDLLKYGQEFRKSNSYATCVDELRRGIPQKGVHGNAFETEADIDETFTYYLNLIDAMRLYGYKPILETTKRSPERHIGVCIASSGELFHFRTGHHRLAIAKQIGLKSVLVHVHCVHSTWVENAILEYGVKTISAIRAKLNTLTKD